MPSNFSMSEPRSCGDFLAESLQVDRAHIQALGLGDTEPLMISGGAAPAERQRRAVVSLTTQP
jgi:outer membrane protein OmpA-like peptidoglycan-associated protein